MGRPIIDLTGQKIGNLTVISLNPEDGIRKNGSLYKRWNCICDCGNETIKTADYLRNAKKNEDTYVASCGCHKYAESLIGRTYGKLTVESEYRIKGKLRYKCKCACGNTCDVSRVSLLKNETVNCGCKRKEKRPECTDNLVGKRFGRLVVKELDLNFYRSKCGRSITKWICQCDCGNVSSVARENLIQGKTKSCGCLVAEKNHKSIEDHLKTVEKIRKNTGTFIDLTGQRFGKLTVLYKEQSQFDSKTKRYSTKWVCQCDCGNVVSVNRSNLRSGHTNSCGCINSVGETKLNFLLSKYKINFRPQVNFPECVDKGKLYFDFGIYDENSLKGVIEYDGKQHFEKVRFNGMSEEKANQAFIDGQRRDSIKNLFCKSNNIPLLRIKYDELENMEDILIKFLIELNLLDRKTIE